MNLQAKILTLFCFAALQPSWIWAQNDLQTLAHTAVRSQATPGVVLGAYQSGELQLSAAGVRKLNDEALITVDDQMHLGSCTKAFTGVLIARLVQQEKLTWDSTIKELLPALAAKIHTDYHDVTLKQLLTHTSGMPANADRWWLYYKSQVSKARDKVFKDSLDDPPEHEPGTKYLYSNLGYAVAGRMAGKVCNTTWEKSLEIHVLRPLGIENAGFGIPGEIGKVTQPWGHRREEDDGPISSVQQDNAPALGPAGTLYMPLEDWLKFCKVFIGEGPEDFLTEESLLALTTPNLDFYSLGWGVQLGAKRKAIGLTHSGSNTMWYCKVYVDIKNQKVFFVAMNSATEEAKTEASSIMRKLRRKR